MIADYSHRLLAVNPTGSYTVTAPAGSGKTELLSQRLLALLAIVEKPEQILAITFTRKAVAEMRERVISALTDANALSDEQIAQQAPHRRATLELARNALRRDQECSWSLMQSPARLRIYTFDAFSASIVRQLPLSSRFGGAPVQSEDPTACYERAAQRVLTQTANDTDVAHSVNVLLRHLDCKVDRLHALLCNTLANRDQWRAVFSRFANQEQKEENFAQLEYFLHRRIESIIADCHTMLEPAAPQLCVLINFANENLAAENGSMAKAYLAELPSPQAANLKQWQEIADFLLTSTGQFRARVDKRHGFPAKSTKPQYSIDDFKNVIAQIQDSSRSADERLQELSWLPQMNELQNNRHLIDALLTVMRHSMAYLELEFQARQEVDFVATSVQSLHALQAADEVAMRLDYQIKHVLVDEFQDTSQVQYDLLQSICRDWGDLEQEGRSLFLVGDAMQSIYAFRNARVALFMHARQYGLASIAMQPLTLNSNFRSHPAILNWVNHCFSHAFPAEDDLVTGASAFVESISQRVDEQDSAVHTFEYELSDDERADEAVHISEQILRIRESDPTSSIAILVRSRKQAEILYPYFRQAGIDWHATEFELLTNQAVVNDLLALTELCVNPSNTVSWFALLRSPLIGLQLSDLLLVSQSRSTSGIAAIASALQLEELSASARQRLKHFLEHYQSYEKNRQRKPIHAAIRSLWQGLGGQLFYADANSMQISQTFFDELFAQTTSSRGASWEKLGASMQRLYANLTPEDKNPVQLMTMHKAKGLEFDTVILPSLDRAGRPDDTELLSWLDSVERNGEPSFLLGMYQPGPQKVASTYSYIRELKKKQTRQENARLLYVACTRAVKRLYLYRAYTLAKESPKASSASSLASIIWPHLEKSAIDITGYNATQQPAYDNPGKSLLRLSASAYSYMEKLPATQEVEFAESESLFAADRGDLLAAETSSRNLKERAIGTVVHRELKEWQMRGKAEVVADRSEIRRTSWSTQLRQLGLHGSLSEIMDQIELVMSAVISDTNNSWLFEAMLEEDASELPMRVMTEHGIQSICIDRTFIDSDGQRWIVDYKVHLDKAATDEQLEQLAQKYKKQLLAYQSAFETPCSLAIYFLYQQRLMMV